MSAEKLFSCKETSYLRNTFKKRTSHYVLPEVHVSINFPLHINSCSFYQGIKLKLKHVIMDKLLNGLFFRICPRFKADRYRYISRYVDSLMDPGINMHPAFNHPSFYENAQVRHESDL
jgi:hypothetical protein